MLLDIIFLGILCLTTVLDIRYRRIPNYTIIIMIMLGVIGLVAEGFPSQRLIGCVFPAIVLLAFNKQRQIGFGDIKLAIAIGIQYGYLPASVILICAMLLTSCYSLFIRHKKGREVKTVPFAPFITIFCLLFFILKHLLIFGYP